MIEMPLPGEGGAEPTAPHLVALPQTAGEKEMRQEEEEEGSFTSCLGLGRPQTPQHLGG